MSTLARVAPATASEPLGHAETSAARRPDSEGAPSEALGGAFLDDLTLPDGIQVQGGRPVEKRWLLSQCVESEGRSPWPRRSSGGDGGGSGVADVELVREDADSDGRVLVRGARVVLLPRGRAEARAMLTPPSAPSGPYSVYFRLTHNGVGFGERLWASVEVA